MLYKQIFQRSLRRLHQCLMVQHSFVFRAAKLNTFLMRRIRQALSFWTKLSPPKTHLPPKFSFSSDFGHLILKMLKNAKFSFVSRKKFMKYTHFWGDVPRRTRPPRPPPPAFDAHESFLDSVLHHGSASEAYQWWTHVSSTTDHTIDSSPSIRSPTQPIMGAAFPWSSSKERTVTFSR